MCDAHRARAKLSASLCNAVRAAIVSCGLAASVGLAAETGDRKVEIALPAQSLSASLIDIGARMGLSIAFTDDQLQGIRAPSIAGVYSAREVLDLILEQSGFRYEFIDARTVRIARARVTPVSNGATKTSTSSVPAQSATTSAVAPEEIVVTGFRASVIEALDVKREAVGIQDSLLAEDIAVERSPVVQGRRALRKRHWSARRATTQISVTTRSCAIGSAMLLFVVTSL